MIQRNANFGDRTYFVLISFFILTLEVFILKFIYPYPSFLFDSYFYLNNAISNGGNCVWPPGYSWFIRICGLITHNDLFLLMMQYYAYGAGALYFYFTLQKFLSLSKFVKGFIYVLLFINPVHLYLTNFIASDILFLGLTFIWFAQLTRLLFKVDLNLLIAHTIIIILCLSVRNQAMLYPIFSIGSIIFFKTPIKQKLIGIPIIILAVFTYIQFISYQTEKAIGFRKYNITSGWQLANNMLLAYTLAPIKKEVNYPPGFKPLNNYVNKFPLTLKGKTKIFNTPMMAGIFILNYSFSPLAQYAVDHNPSDLHSMSPYKYIGIGKANVDDLYKSYAVYLIKNYPGIYLNYYLIPNICQFLCPNVECLNKYNVETNVINGEAKVWFGYLNDYIQYPNIKPEHAFNNFDILFFISGIIFILLVIFYYARKDLIKQDPAFSKVLPLIIFFLALNFAFMVLAAPVVLRYLLLNQFFFFTCAAIITQAICNRKNRNEPLN
ncbi:hypothetical protein SIO70_00405 [Chitinophaga sancti]|uniref:hypothetical protein n=1 Tax=Chitinophaga sancti TaxID=1004 RepID=UPI002A75052F|nr:hypothetical protein [Chitinophaga sancti]WPQ63324.1 hypothetical protein SIO70_00405 [Chitinophaga sancti]